MFGLRKVDRIKKNYPLENVIRSYGIELKARGNDAFEAHSPFNRDDHTPSFKVTPSKQLWKDFSTDQGGDVITFVEKMEGVSNLEAINLLSNDFKSKPTESTVKKEIIPSDLSNNRLLKEVCKVYHDNFKKNKAAQSYLESRGFKNKDLWLAYDIGFSDGGSLKSMLPESGNLISQLKEMGILNDKGNESFYKCVTFPIKDVNENIVGMYGRNIESPRHHYLKGERKAVWNSENISGNTTLILTESILDSFSWIESGFDSIPLYGVSGFVAAHQKLFEEQPIQEICFCLDNDKQGKQATEKLFEKLKQLKIKLTKIELPENIKDSNELLNQKDTRKETFQKLFDHRISLPLIVVSDQAIKEEKSSFELKSHNASTAIFEGDHLLYQVKGFKKKYSDAMRVVISLQHHEQSVKHTDRIDLYVNRNRKSFANTASNKLNLQAAKIEDHLNIIIEGIEDIQAKSNQQDDLHEVSHYRMTEAERKEAMTFLKRSDLMEQLVKDLDICGYVGENSAKTLCYLSATSRITDRPISLTVRASSGSGKSNMFDRVCELMPAESVKFYSRISMQSLYYMNENDLKHCVLIIDEKAGSEDSDYSLRTLMSRGKLSLAVVNTDQETGKAKTVNIELTAPCAVWESTTASYLNPENLSRVFEIWLGGDSRYQTEQIHQIQKREFSKSEWKVQANKETVCRIHQNAQRLLKPYKVDIPFINRLSFPTIWTRARRDHERFLNLIAVIAMLHQFQRELKIHEGIEYIEATKEDYRLAYQLSADILKVTFSPLPKESLDLLNVIYDYVQPRATKEGVSDLEFTFTRKEIREFIHWSEYKTRQCLNQLHQMEYVAKLTGKFGSTFLYRLVVSRDDLSNNSVLKGLTHPDEL